MFENYQKLIRNQYLASLRTIDHCLNKCSDLMWNQPVGIYDFSQVLFHALFFADVYLGPGPDAVESQSFHAKHANVFAGYEQWEEREPEKTYEREFIGAYLQHCRDKMESAIDAMTETSLAAPSGFFWIEGTAAEVHVYNIRHLQHHAAQMILRLRLESKADVPWVKSGWQV